MSLGVGVRESPMWRGPGTVRPWNWGATRTQGVVSAGPQDREPRAVCCNTASSGLMSRRQRTWGAGPAGGSGGAQRPVVAQRGAMRPGPPRCGCSLMGCSSLASARSAGYAGSLCGDASARAVRWASRPRRGSTGGEAGAGARPGGARGALLERARRRDSPSRGRVRGAAGSGGGGSVWASIGAPSSASRKSKLRQWRLLKGAGAVGGRSHGGCRDAGPGAATLISWYTVDTNRSGGSVRVILKEVPRLAVAAYSALGDFCPGGRCGSGWPLCNPGQVTPLQRPHLPGAQWTQQSWLPALAEAAGSCSMPASGAPAGTQVSSHSGPAACPWALPSGPLSAGMEPVSQKGHAVAAVTKLLSPYPWMVPLLPVVTLGQVWVESPLLGQEGGRGPSWNDCSCEALFTDFFGGAGFTRPW